MKDTLREGHDYDGIEEFDNPSPKWLLYLFYASIVFAFWYMGYYTAKGYALAQVEGEGQALSWSRAHYLQSERVSATRFSSLKKPELSPDELRAHLKKPAVIAHGENVYKSNCASCHGDQGQGLVGPNLVDDHWLTGGRPEDIVQVISTGLPEKGMPGWLPILGQDRVQAATAYILSIRGRKVPGAKEPQGEKTSVPEGW